MSEIANDKWINIDEAAEYLGVKPGTIRDWIRKEKGIPAHKIGKQWNNGTYVHDNENDKNGDQRGLWL